jgi:putative MATE family efflux protein
MTINMTAPKSQRDLTVGPVAKTLLLFALPSLGVNILQSMNSSVNAIWVGRFLGEEALAATSNAGMVMFLMFSTLFGFSIATTILIGQNIGRGNIEGVRRTMGTSLGLFSIAGIITAITGWVFAPQLLRALATPDAVFPLALSYLRIIFLGMPFSFVMILLTSALRGLGDSVTPLWNTVLNVALDVILNPVFILGIGPIPAMGIAGSALATLVAGLISVAILIVKIYRQDSSIRLRGPELRWLRPNPEFAKPILKMGLPMGLSMIIMSASALAMMGLVNREGVETVAAYGLLQQLWNYAQMPAVAVGSAVSAMAAQNIGAGRWDRISRIAGAGVTINILMTSALIGFITLFAAPLLALFVSSDSPVIPIAIHINYIVGWSFILMGVSMVLTFLVRANGAVIVPLISLIIASVLVRFAVGFGLHPLYGADAIWWAFIAASIASFVLAVAYYFHGSWRHLHTLDEATVIPAHAIDVA